MASLYAGTIQEAKELFEKKEYGKAIEIFSVYENDGEAQYYLGKAYSYGMGVEKDSKKAFEYAQKSAIKKFPEGINLLGFLYEYGYGAEKDEMKAFLLYSEASTLGNAFAMNNLARLYYTNSVIKRDINKAIYWFEQAIENGVNEGYLGIADIYRQENKRTKALEYYLKYEKLEPDNIPLYVYEKIGLNYLALKNFNRAYTYILKATQLGAYYTSWNLFYMVRNNQVSIDKKEEALDWLTKITDSKVNNTKTLKHSQNLLYLYYYYDSNKSTKAIDVAKKFYQSGNIQMGCNLASYYGNNFNNEIDYEKSYNIASKIIEENKPSLVTESCYSALAYMYRTGYYTSRDIEKAIEIYKLMFYDISKGKNDLIAKWIAECYLENLKDFENAQKWYQIAYDLTKDEKYLTIVHNYKKSMPTFQDMNNTNEQSIFPIIDNFYKKEQVASVLESDKYYFVATGLKDVKIYDKEDLTLVKELRGWIGNGADGIITQMAYDENNQLLYCAGINSATDFTKNDLIKVFNINSGKIVKIIDNKNSMASTYLNISLDGKYLVSINNNCQIQVINAETNELQYYNFSNRVNFTQVNIVQKDNDYIINALGNDNNLYSFSVNKKRQISKESFTYQTAFKTFNTNHAQNILKTDLNTIEDITFDNNQIYLQNNQGTIKSFNIKDLTLSTVNRNINFLQTEVSHIEIKLKNAGRTLKVYKNNKLLSTIELLYTPIVKYKILDDKYIVVITSDMAATYIFNLEGRPIANLRGFLSIQNNIVYKDNYLFSYGDDNIIHVWNIDNLDELNNTKEVFDQDVVMSMYKTVGGNILEMLDSSDLDDYFLELQMKQNKWNFKPTSTQYKTSMKIILLKKEDIYPLSSLYSKDNDWILFNNKGLFASSKDEQNLLKYHLNQGLKKEAKIIENRQIFEKFYRPDLLKKILAKEKVDVEIDIRSVLLNTKAPNVKIINHKLIDKKNLDFIYQICDAGSGVSNETILINGVSVNLQNTRGFSVEEDKSNKEQCSIYKNNITLQPGSNTIAVKAFDKDKTISNTSENLEVQTDYVEDEKPNLYLLSIAVSDYKNKDLTLKYPVKDAQAVKNIINAKSKILFEKINTYELFDSEVIEQNIEKIFDEISKKIKINDVFVLYIAGHGVTKDGLYYFLPYAIDNTLANTIESKAISLNTIKYNLSKVITNKSLILLDTCQSGAILENIVDDKATLTRLSNDDNRNYIVASSKNQVALEGYKNHGIFTYTILDAFDYAYFGKQKELTVTNLAGYIETEVPKITKEIFHFEQIPQKHLSGNTFSIGTK